MPTTPLFLGLDVGTQSVRAALIDPQGACLAYATAPLDTTFPQPGWAEQDALQWWQALRQCVPQALARANAASRRKAIAPGAQTSRPEDAGPVRALLGGENAPAAFSPCLTTLPLRARPAGLPFGPGRAG